MNRVDWFRREPGGSTTYVKSERDPGDTCTDHPGPRLFFLLACLDCGEDLVHPFGSAEEREQWRVAHRSGSGHDQWLSWEEPRWSSPDHVTR